MIKLTIKEYKELTSGKKRNKIPSARSAGAVHKGNKEADLQSAYDTAIQTLRNLQVFGGDLFLGRSNFKLKIQIKSKSQADGANIYKGIEDALNKIAWFDDKQNKFFE